MDPIIKTHILVDTHVHIYPKYDLRSFFDNANKNLNTIAQKLNIGASHLIKVLCLTERSDNNFFDSLSSSQKNQDINGFRLELYPGDVCSKVSDQPGNDIYLLKGFQVISNEGLEILSLVSSDRPKDGMPIRQVISEINSKNGIPVLPWSPGKWLGKRGEIMRSLINEFSPSDFCIGDISMRPVCAPYGALLNLATLKNFRILAGSDPLSSSYEEQQVGRYVSMYECTENANQADLARLVTSKIRSEDPKVVGKRNSLFTAISRWLRSNLSKN